MLSFLLGFVISIAAAWHLVKHFWPWIGYDLRLFRFIFKTIIKLRRRAKSKPVFTMVDRLVEQSKRLGDKPMFIFENKTWSYKHINKISNHIARVLHSAGVKQRDTVAVMMTNHPMFASVWFGTAKAGAIPAFINFSLRGKSLLHCITISECDKLIISDDDAILKAIRAVESDLQNMGISVYILGNAPKSEILQYMPLLDLADKESGEESPMAWREVRDFYAHFCYMFTSGTTGLPKAAIVSHCRATSAAQIFELIQATSQDVVYTPLPLYHGSAGLIGLLGTIDMGCTMALRKKFSAREFWDDCRAHNVTVIQYIGETLRYLCNQPKKPDDKYHDVRIAVGNGLSPAVWGNFHKRFGEHIAITEFYSSTEGNVCFYNITNTPNCVGIYSPIMNALNGCAFLKYDFVNQRPIRDDNGRCIRAELGEPGLLVGKISYYTRFAGYRGDPKITNKKVLRDVLTPGDEYFNTGDILVREKNYRISFYDRVGDTYRWKGENVSVCEVINQMTGAPGLSEINVFGVKVPGTEGRAGMMIAVLDDTADKLDGRGVYEHACLNLPPCARPLFIRVSRKLELTETYKLQRVAPSADVFDLENADEDFMYMMDAAQEKYVPLTAEDLVLIKNGNMGI